ncbi:NACHT domain-containing protein [Actinomycetes bacterium KLBMP 9797]
MGAAGLLWFARWLLTLPEGDLSRADQRSSVINAVTGVIGLVLTALSVVLALRPFRQGDPSTVLDSAAARLAQRLRIGYERAAGDRQLQLLGPLKIMWEPVGGGVISQASQRIEGTGGNLDALVAALARLSPEQLVITGDPASGKSSMALQLALTLLKSQDEGMRRRVPVFLSVSSWRPREQPLSDWLISQLAEEHPELTRPEYGKQAPRDLVEQDRVLPILDGFDELSQDLHDTARGRLVEAAASGRPFILTIRTEAYLKAVRAQGKAFGQAAVVRLRPLTTAQAIAALTADDIGEVRQRWEPVERRMKNANSPLARVLSSPLMVYLARVAYSSPDMDPVQLTRFKRDKEIINHLFDSYLPALYRSRYDPLRVRTWLGMLAHHLKTSERSTDLAWWRLLPLVPRSRTVFILTIGAIVNYVFFLQYGPRGVIVGFVAIPLCLAVTDGRRPRQLRLREIGPKRFLAATALGVATGCAFIPIIEPGHDWRFAVLAVATLGTTVTLLASLAFSLRLPDDSDTTQPRAMLANDRTALLGIITLVGGAAGIRAGVQYNPARGLLDGLQSMLLVGLLVSAGMRLGSGWLTFGIVRLSLSLRRGFPLRLLAFLEDAHRRGVLRRSGPFYQFRHADLQRYLTVDRPTLTPQPSRPAR